MRPPNPPPPIGPLRASIPVLPLLSDAPVLPAFLPLPTLPLLALSPPPPAYALSSGVAVVPAEHHRGPASQPGGTLPFPLSPTLRAPLSHPGTQAPLPPQLVPFPDPALLLPPRLTPSG